MIADWVVFGFIALSILIGASSGLDGQIKRLGKGIKGALIAAAIVFVFGASILSWGFVGDGFDKLRNVLQSNNLSFLTDGVLFDSVRYGMLYIVVLIAVKVAFEVIGSLLGTKTDGIAGGINKIFGAVLAGAIGVIVVMLGMVAVVAINNQHAIEQIQNSACKIFLEYNPFLEIFKLKYNG